ncbi:type II secretory pathway, ATPase PulE/Tfp pilus assembly pathway, ATPase PilB [endosymbiont of Acanthamoeba sp. UWC8]|uniref:GspE/PulE family protein n=1 Tax=endosymbiont of Acanthamoeba sp. UWC8 TaxID=86106 RepID=UPI0004D0D7F8|nr:GspE/PulE family protein [endosymbiont of Acanthamoeba sp. UWC8]AIF80921.1 type II secretory pathway, ATPase PulE/Tfp pilus assembly pathway, ATPase PilB [endosymbiont of Acanthamoeba sp. UWC8]
MSIGYDNHPDDEEFSPEQKKKNTYAAIEEINEKAMRILKEHGTNIAESDEFIPNLNYPDSSDSNLKEVTISLEEALLSKGLISKDQLQVALKQQKEAKDKQDLGKTLIDLGFITETALAEVFAESSGIETLDLKAIALDVDLIRKIPKTIATQYKILPISLDGDKLHVVTTDVYNIVAFDQIKKFFDKRIQVVAQYANESQINDVIEQYYEYEMKVEGILKEIEAELEKGRNLSADDQGYLNPTVRLVDAILFDAIRRGASDIHLEPENNFVRLRYRIDGQLMQILTFHKEYWSAIAVRIKILSSMNIAETRSPQDGRISYVVMGRTVDFRVSTQPTVHGENIVARILDKAKALVSLKDLGLSEYNVELLYRLLKRPEGIIIVTGPTGSGKSTTLYSILSFINSINVNIMTLEDPVEYQLSLIRQSGVREGTGMNFADGIRSMMRQDPDIIFVGEVRDKDTASMTIRAAMTGHQVFTTLHTNDSVGAIPRLMDLGIKGSLLAGTIICMVAQRLARKLCIECKEEYSPNEFECKILGHSIENPPKLYKHKGCPKCYDSGYKGRVAIMEILAVDEEIDDMISREASRKQILSYAKENGFIAMAQDGINKVLEGTIDIDELISTVDMTERMK